MTVLIAINVLNAAFVTHAYIVIILITLKFVIMVFVSIFLTIVRIQN